MKYSNRNPFLKAELIQNTVRFSFRFWLCLCLTVFCFAAPSKAQQNKADSALEYEDDSITTNDSISYDFEWKTNPTDAFQKNKINTRISSDTAVQRLKNEAPYWYITRIEDMAQNPARLHTDKKYRDSLVAEGLWEEERVPTMFDKLLWQNWFDAAKWVFLTLIFLAAIIYFLASNKINLFYRSPAKAQSGEATGEENIFATDYKAMLAQSERAKDFRLAVRILYLQLLKDWSEKNIISYHPSFTDMHYLRQMQNKPMYKTFSAVIRYYEGAWYGGFAVPEVMYEKIKTEFTNLKKEARQL